MRETRKKSDKNFASLNNILHVAIVISWSIRISISAQQGREPYNETKYDATS